MYDRVLVPLDGSKLAEAALERPAGLLAGLKAHVVAMRAVPHPVGAARDPQVVLEAETYLRELEQSFPARGLTGRAMLVVGLPAETILDTARREGASLIVMASHGRTGLERWTLGSVAEKVIRAAHTPVLVVHEGTEPATRTVLVPQDGSDFARTALPHASAVARALGARITLAHVFERPRLRPSPEAPELPLEQAASDVRAAGVPVTLEFLEGDPAEQILAAGERLGAAAIVMSTHGRTGPSRWVFGSVTEKVLRGAKAPLLIARA